MRDGAVGRIFGSLNFAFVVTLPGDNGCAVVTISCFGVFSGDSRTRSTNRSAFQRPPRTDVE